jgi:lipoprotein-anchoring transpeptidase ErfK/SrfK
MRRIAAAFAACAMALTGFVLVASNARGAEAPGLVQAVGNAAALGAPANQPKPLVDLVATSTGKGYWIAGAEGAVFTYGDATFAGALTAKPPSPIVELLPTPTDKGYWLVGADGAVFTFGDATFAGAWTGPHEQVVAAARTTSGDGYWLVGNRGTVKQFGKAPLIDGVKAAVVAAAPNPTGDGMWLIGADGGVFAVGGAPFLGSLNPNLLNSPFTDIAATATGDGLLMLTANGLIAGVGKATVPGNAAPPPGTQATALALSADGGALVLSSAQRTLNHPLIDLPAGSGQGRRVVYANRQQQVWIVGDDGQVVRTYLVSGKPGVPPPGTYHVQSKSQLAYARANGITMRHMVRFNGGIGFHEIPRYANNTPMQTEAQLGTYQSHGCVRQAAEDADFMFGWARVGDTVVVLP